ncbi:glycosyltransferase family 4 protein [Microvirga alba]|uniref:Glycosyltransferase family 4 protein n=1 Tax=Microvirga alba TaxID=2791025 RepID=A0A931FSH6_9HYPH|nr:glycosyltransferase family 4 protein [Microvirga alba]MBF9233721.1 glycosyltransferase family 4 protein [Microvirga alba]
MSFSTRPVGGAAFPPSHLHPLAGRTILQIIPELEAGGAERTTVDIAEGLAHSGARALVATEGGRLVGELQAKGGIWLPFQAATKNPVSMFLNVRRLAKLCQKERVSLIHARSRAPAWVALGAARSLNIPFVTTYHGSYAGRSSVKVLYNSVMARGDAVIANSHYTGDLIRSLYPLANDRVRVIHRGTDFLSFSPPAVAPERVEVLRKSWNVAPHERVVLLAARLTGWKGQKVLIEAAAKLRDAGVTDVAYILAGDPQGRDSYVRELDNLIESRKLQGIVRRVGHCTDMPAAFLAASVVTVPSTEPEAFGRSAVEAQAMGTPVVVSDLGAVPETVLSPPAVLPHERTGWRIAPGDADALAEAVGAALSLGASARDALGTRARMHVQRHFSLENMVSSTLDVYSALLEGHFTRRTS